MKSSAPFPATTSSGPVMAVPEKRRPRRLSVNITPIERSGRIIIGALGAVFGALLLASASGAVAVVLEVLLVVAGLDLIVTGALGHCPLYQKLGYVPASLRRSR
jgi:Protein of unknown function (DUF2892)